MHRLVSLAGVLGAGFTILHAQPRPVASSSIVETRSVALPAYASNPRIAQFNASADEYAKQVNDPDFAMQRLTYRSDGLEVFAYLYRPVNLPTDHRLPVVIFNRGSYVRDDFSYEVLPVANQLGHEGYVTIAPMLRGSGGAAGVDEMGGADLHDIFNVLPIVRELPYIDSNRIFMYGESRGGIMSLMAARDGFPAKAIAVWGTITDLAGYAQKDPSVRQLGTKIWPGYPANEKDIMDARSAIRWPERINVPVLLMNGAADPQVSPSHSLELASALDRLRKPYELKIFYGEGHVSPRRAAERVMDIHRWFARFDAIGNRNTR